MPCGVFDKRRGGHRCIACRKAHARCDGVGGQKTCSYCRARQLSCSYRPRATGGYQMVRFRAQEPTPSHALTVDTWKYVTACFGEATGTLPMFDCMRSREMVALSQSDPTLREMVEIVGEVYMALATGETYFVKYRKKFQRLVLQNRSVSSRKIQALTAEGKWSPGLLGSVMMIPIVSSLLFPQEDPCHFWGSEVSDFIVRTTRNEARLPEFDAGLVRLFQAIDVSNSVARNKAPTCPDFACTIFSNGLGASAQTCPPAPKILRLETDYIYSALWHWAMLQKRMFTWLVETMMMGGHLSAEQRVDGIEIICAASSLQVKMLEHFLNLRDTSGPDRDVLVSYNYWILAGITQLLRNDGWKLLDCDIANLSEGQLYEYALETLEYLDSTTRQAGLCAVALLPLVVSMGFEMKTGQDKARVLSQLEAHRARGPLVVDQFQQQLELIWPRVDGPFTPPCEILFYIYSQGLLEDQGHADHTR